MNKFSTYKIMLTVSLILLSSCSGEQVTEIKQVTRQVTVQVTRIVTQEIYVPVTVTPTPGPSSTPTPSYDPTWMDIDLIYSDQDLIEMTEDQFILDATYRTESNTFILGWTGIVNGVDLVQFSFAGKEWESIIMMVAFRDMKEDQIINLPINVCVKEQPAPDCSCESIIFDPTSYFDPTSMSPGKSIDTIDPGEILAILQDQTGKKIRVFPIFPLPDTDLDLVLDDLSMGGEIQKQEVFNFIKSVCSEDCYLERLIVPNIASLKYIGPRYFDLFGYRFRDPWGLFLSGMYLYSGTN